MAILKQLWPQKVIEIEDYYSARDNNTISPVRSVDATGLTRVQSAAVDIASTVIHAVHCGKARITLIAGVYLELDGAPILGLPQLTQVLEILKSLELEAVPLAARRWLWWRSLQTYLIELPDRSALE